MAFFDDANTEHCPEGVDTLTMHSMSIDVNILWPIQNGHRFTDNILKRNFVSEDICFYLDFIEIHFNMSTQQ